MGWKNIEDRKKYYNNNKDLINRRRRRYSSRLEVKERIKQQDKKWRIRNKEKLKIRNKVYKKKYDIKIKNIVFNHYGTECACCGESNLFFLSIDHMNGGGTQHRIKIKNKFYNWLIKNNFPKGYQTLCFNCNWGRHINKGICPHKNEKI